jgi:hypothetical protein
MACFQFCFLESCITETVMCVWLKEVTIKRKNKKNNDVFVMILCYFILPPVSNIVFFRIKEGVKPKEREITTELACLGVEIPLLSLLKTLLIE